MPVQTTRENKWIRSGTGVTNLCVAKYVGSYVFVGNRPYAYNKKPMDNNWTELFTNATVYCLYLNVWSGCKSDRTKDSCKCSIYLSIPKNYPTSDKQAAVKGKLYTMLLLLSLSLYLSLSRCGWRKIACALLCVFLLMLLVQLLLAN